MEDTNPTTPLIQILHQALIQADKMAKAPKFGQGQLIAWVNRIRVQLEKIYGKDSLNLEYFPPISRGTTIINIHGELEERVAYIRLLVQSLESLPYKTKAQIQRRHIFIGHGRSPLWRELEDFLADRLHLPWDEFNREAIAGISTSERLERMLFEAAFAFLIMTAEEEHSDLKIYARPNVIHEIGLFQGKLGFRRAIILLEEGCTEFSNIIGLTQIRFPKGDIAARFEDIRKVLEREGLA